MFINKTKPVLPTCCPICSFLKRQGCWLKNFEKSRKILRELVSKIKRNHQYILRKRCKKFLHFTCSKTFENFFHFKAPINKSCF